MSTYDDASLIYYPSGYKASKAYSLKPTDGSGDLDFTRASSATRVNEQGLIEGVRTNSLLYSEQFDNAYWSKSLGTLTANSAISPDGTTTAEKWEKTSGANSLSRVFISTSSYGSIGVYTYSVFLKNIDSTSVLIRMDSAGNTANLTFDWVSVTGSGSNVINVGFDNYGNGWSRVWITANVTSIAWSLDSMVLYADVAGKSLYLWGAMLEQSASATEYIPTTTTAVSVGITNNVPRIDYTSGCGKLLLEPQRTNLVAYSNDFSQWNITNLTITANNVTSPEGTLNASKVEMTGNGSIRNANEITFNNAYSYSIFVKKGNSRYVTIRSSFFTQSIIVVFDLDTLTAQTDGKIENYGNDWYRLSISKNISSDADKSGFFYVYLPDSLANPTTSVSGNYAYFYGGQIEDGSYPTSYIPTTSTAVTRVADSATKSGISSLIGQTEGVMFIEAKLPAINEGSIKTLFSLFSNSSNRILSYASGTTLTILDTNAGVNQEVYNFNFSAILGQTIKLAIRWVPNETKIFINGVLVRTYLLNPSVGFNSFTLGVDNFGGSQLGGGINSYILFTSSKSDSDLITLTTI